jgi:hypothetical protein
MTTKKGGCSGVLVALALVAAFACGCGGGRADSVDHGGPLASEDAQRCGFTSRPGGYAERADAWKAYLRGVREG